MPQFGSPITAGYGLGQVGQGITQGMLQGQIQAPQLGYEKLRNQALQTQLANEKAQQEALSQEAPATEEGQQDLTPLDKPVRDMEVQIKALRQAGQGQAVQRMMPEYINIRSQQHLAQIGGAARALLGTNPKAALPYLPAAGFGEVSDITVAPGPVNPASGQPTRIYTFTMPDGSSTQMGEQQIAMVAAKPEMMAQLQAQEALYGSRMQDVASKVQHRSAMEENKKQQTIWQHQDKLKQIEQSGENTQAYAGAKLGAAKITANAATDRFNSTPQQQAFRYYTDRENGLGLDPDAAITALTQAKEMTKTVSPAQAAGEVTKKMVAAAPNKFQNDNGDPDPEKIANFQSALAHSLTEKAAKPAAPTGAGKGKTVGVTLPKGFTPSDEQTKVINDLIAKKDQAGLDRYKKLITKDFKEQ